jgi:hypothetical protein
MPGTRFYNHAHRRCRCLSLEKRLLSCNTPGFLENKHLKPQAASESRRRFRSYNRRTAVSEAKRPLPLRDRFRRQAVQKWLPGGAYPWHRAL